MIPQEPYMIAAIAAVILLLILPLYRLLLRSFSPKEKIRVEAQLKDMKFMRGDYNDMGSVTPNDYYIATYEYSVNGKTYQKNLVSEDPGATVFLYYPPGRPGKADVGTVTATQKGCRNLIIRVIIPFILYFLIFRIVAAFVGYPLN